MPNRFLTITELAHYTGRARCTIALHVWRGRIRSVKERGLILILQSDLDKFMQEVEPFVYPKGRFENR